MNVLGDDPKTVRIYDEGDVIDDVVGPMVNRKVIVNVVARPNGRFAYRDIQAED